MNERTVSTESTGVETYSVLGVPVGLLTMANAIAKVNEWIDTDGVDDKVRLVTFTNVHMVVEAALRPNFADVLNKMDINCPDGAPIFWLGRKKFGRRVSKIGGPDFMPAFCKQSVARGYRHFLYGGAPGVAEAAATALTKLYPGIQIAGFYSPPFRPLDQREKEEIAATINDSQADVLWVCLGCPKQEQWMNDNKYLLRKKVVLAVGQAVDILAGTSSRAPRWIITSGLEWLYRLASEPRRLWRRYLVTNALFIYFLLTNKVAIPQV